MMSQRPRPSTARRARWRGTLPLALSAVAALSLLGATSASAAAQPAHFGEGGYLAPGNLLVSRTAYAEHAGRHRPDEPGLEHGLPRRGRG